MSTLLQTLILDALKWIRMLRKLFAYFHNFRVSFAVVQFFGHFQASYVQVDVSLPSILVLGQELVKLGAQNNKCWSVVWLFLPSIQHDLVAVEEKMRENLARVVQFFNFSSRHM